MARRGPYGTGDTSNVVVDVHRPDTKGFGDAEAAADAWRAAVEALDEPDNDDELVAEVLRVADANTVDGAVDTSHLTSYGELGNHVMRELGPGTVAVDYVERCALTWRATARRAEGPVVARLDRLHEHQLRCHRPRRRSRGLRRR